MSIEQLSRVELEGPASLVLARTPGDLALRRAWPRSTGHVLLEYVDAGGALVPGQWIDDAGRRERVAEATAASGGGAVVVATAAGPVLLQTGGADRKLQALRETLARPGAVLLSHRPERRAVVSVAVAGATRYVKVVRPGRAAALATLARRLAGDRSLHVEFAEVLAVDDARGLVEWSALRGSSLHDLLDGGDELDAALTRTGAALRSLHACAAGETVGRAHDAAAEARVVESWLAHARTHRASVHAPVSVSAQAIVQRLAGGTSALVTLHRDFHDKQVLVDSRGKVGLIDLDTTARGEAALDVANMLVHLELRSLQGLLMPGRVQACAAAFLEGYAHGCDPERLRAYADAARLRLACVYAFRPRWFEVAERVAGLVGAPVAGTR